MLATLTWPAAAPLELPPAARVQVRSADELRRALRDARDRPLVLDASVLNSVLRADAERQRLEVQGAMTWRDLAHWLGTAGAPLERWLKWMAPPATVGEAVSLDAPAPDGLPLARYVDSLALVTLDGELRRIDRGHDASLFRHVAGGQGVFGVLYSVTLRIDALLQAAASACPPAVLELPPPAGGPGRLGEVDLLLPPEEALAFVTAARALATERRMALRRVAVRELRQGAETALSWAKRDWAGITLSLERVRPTLGASVHLTEVRRLLFAAALARGGSFPARAAYGASRAQLEAAYPELAAFLAEKRRYDPAERLQNDWYRGVTGMLRHVPQPRVRGAATRG
jgi:FAD/FMN-containing dehydrogenase